MTYLESICDRIVALATVIHMEVDGILAAYYDHLVLEDVRRVPNSLPWSKAYDIIQWFYIVSHTYFTPDI